MPQRSIPIQKIDMPELWEKFGGSIPKEVFDLIFSIENDHMTVAELNLKIDEIAERWRQTKDRPNFKHLIQIAQSNGYFHNIEPFVREIERYEGWIAYLNFKGILKHNLAEKIQTGFSAPDIVNEKFK